MGQDEAHQLLESVTGSWAAQAIYVAAELGISDHLAQSPLSAENLASAVSAHASSLHRLLRALSTLNICKEREDGLFEITSKGLLLKTGAPDSLRSWILWWGGHLWNVWGSLLYSVRTGESARKWLTGKDGFEHLEKNPEAAKIFSQAMVELTRLASTSIVHAYDFSQLNTVMDVGGGYGELLLAILKKNTSVAGILFDLPHAIDNAKLHWEKSGLTSRCRFISGNFSKSVPHGADAYILKSVIHDWDDEKSKVILENCRKAMPKNGRLILIERVLPDKFKTSSAHQAAARSDLTMLIALAGRERTESDFRNLLKSAGFSVNKILQANDALSIIEAFPQ
jgi:ubiquinone/menaquinone biosynthesis C-methylase UbiE